QRGDFGAATAASMNDFEDVIAARQPAIASALDALRSAGARLARLSGSGSSCFALAETEREAKSIAERFNTPSGTRVNVVRLDHTKVWR
ncbi:MAG: hypothetical protein ACREML_11905, partial [Vulcanimicrobiaceae bacterium]